jgi:GPI mannosyltransferase 2
MKTSSQLLFIGLAYKAFVFALLFAAGYLPDFDKSSPHVYSRWDSIHFETLAQTGYKFEHQWAFFPGVPFVSSFLPSQLASGIFIGLFSIPTIPALYDLSVVALKSPSLAYVATLLSIFTSSPAVVHVSGYAEPLFTFCTYRGLLECSRRHWYFAALYFMIASSIRANGILLAGFLLWSLLVHPFLFKRKACLLCKFQATTNIYPRWPTGTPSPV